MKMHFKNNFISYTKVILSVPVFIFALFYLNRRKRKKIDSLKDNRQIQNNKSIKKLPLSQQCLLPTKEEFQIEAPSHLRMEKSVDMLSIWAGDKEGNSFLVRLFRHRHRLATLWFSLRLKDGTTLCFPDAPNAVVQNAWTKEWSARGLRMKVIEPFRRWRITFKGLLRRRPPGSTEADDTDDQVQFVKFNFLWIACSDFMDYRRTTSSKLLENTISQEPWHSKHWNAYFREIGKNYEQWGILQGNVWPSNEESTNLYLRGLRQRWCGLGLDPATWQNSFVQIIAVMPEGTMVSLRGLESPDGLMLMTFGQVRGANGNLQIVDWTDLSLEPWGENAGEHLPQVSIRLNAGGRIYSLVLHLQPEREQLRFLGGLPWSWEARCSNAVAGLNHLQGYAHVEMLYPYSGPCSVEKINPITRLYDLNLPKSSTELLVVSLDEQECRSSAFVGGKAASLALLRTVNDSQFQVPGGFCLTPRALEAHLNANPEVKEAIRALAETSEKDLSSNCLKANRLIRESTFCSKVESAFAQALHNLLPDDTLCVAVRSSALGEDSVDVSAAGQNDTFLGVPLRAEPLFSAVLACWASLYSEKAIIYRRRHGQPIGLDSSMAVVVQSMVFPRAAGVLFTNHPVTGDPSKMIITANYGLGESVVSASAEPDTMEVHRDWRGNFSISNRIIGTKLHQIVAQDPDEISDEEQMSGTRSEDVPLSASCKLCISEIEILLLAATGARFESMFGDARDIEWALDINKGQLWILQARPITSTNAWTEDELIHEFDSALASEKEVLTRANVGEVMPNACTALTLSISKIGLDHVLKSFFKITDKYSDSGFISSHNFLILNILNVFRFDGPVLTMQEKINFMTTLGNVLLTQEIHDLGIERHGSMKPMNKLALLLKTLYISFQKTSSVNSALKIAKNCNFPQHLDDDLVSFYKYLDENLVLYRKLVEIHVNTSQSSSFSQIILVSFLANSKQEINSELKSQLAHFLSNSNKELISGEIPFLLGSIAKAAGPELATAPSGRTQEWLRQHRPEQAKALDQFLDRHGHRCLNEMEFASETWKMNPEQVCDILRSLCTQSHNNRPDCDSSKPTVKGFKGYLVNNWIRPWAQNCVEKRELSKYAFILMVNKFREGYLRFAQLLVRKGRLPEANLVWHLTHTELGQLSEKSDPQLIDKAWRRQRYYKNWNKFKFPELWIGISQFIKESEYNFEDGISRLEATPVSNGTVRGRACVVLDIQEAFHIQQGDILVTYCTDIGWSPYFPKISGLVTELGGLISHGAVVAREYGLPCLVGAHGATKLFKTGDTVLLAADSGYIELVTNEGKRD